MFSSPTGTSRNRDRSLSKSLSKAALSFVGSGPPLDKQLKEAIMEGNEDKAINIYTANEGGKSLMRNLHVSKAFPSKKIPNYNETPLHLTAKYALAKLFVMFLEYGGNPGVRNFRGETCIHSACSLSSNPFKREEIVNVILEWRSKNNEGNSTEAVPIDMLDEDGNAGIHLAAHSNLLPCVELLINYGARLNIINKYNYSPCEMADKAGFRVLGTMIELAWVFMFVDQQIEDTYLHHKFSADHQVTRVVLDSHSLTLTRLVDFINQVIKFTADSIGESMARAEVMLTHYSWDATKLKKDWLSNSVKVLKDVHLQPKSVPIPTETTVEVQKSNEPICGSNLNEIYLDAAYKNVGPFAVLQDGKRIQYVIRTYNGKTGLYPVEQDPAKSSLTDPFISENSHINPKATEPCSVCNERMFEPCGINHFTAGTLVEAKHREIACGSGHKFCFGCWSDHLQAQVLRENGNGVGCLPCPGSKCGEILDLQWAPVMLKSQDLLNRLLAQRQRHVIDCIGLRWCPVSNCGLLVHVAGPGLNKKGDANFPQSAICANGHAFCLSCNREAHAPCSCANWTLWAENVREESKNTNTKDPTNASNILLGSATQKRCPQCTDGVAKEEGCNHMHCRKCRYEFCWICMQDWTMHADNQNGYFQCNRIMDDPLHAKHRDNGEEKDGNEAWNPSVFTNRARTQKQILFVHHFSRFQAHGDSMKLEAKVMEEAVSRISLGLQAAAEGEIKWLLGDSVPNPYSEKEETEDVFNHMRDLNVNDLKDTVITEYFLPKQECVEFLIDAFEELEKCRVFLKWSYPFALFEFDENFQKQTGPTGSSHSHKHDEHRIQFDLLQAALEASTERLSDVIARRRLRGTRSQIALATRTARLKRLELEAVVLASSVQTHEPSAGSSLSSWSSHLNEKKVTAPQVPVPGTPLHNSSSDLVEISKTASTGRIQGPPISAFMSPMPVSNDNYESDEEVVPYKESPPASPRVAQRPVERVIERPVEQPIERPAEVSKQPEIINLDASDSMAVQRLMSVGFTKDEAVSTHMRMTERPFFPNAIYSFTAPLYEHASSDVAPSQTSQQSYARTQQYSEVVQRTQHTIQQQQQQQQYVPEPRVQQQRQHQQQQHQEVFEEYSPPPPVQQQHHYQQQQHHQQQQYHQQQQQQQQQHHQQQQHIPLGSNYSHSQHSNSMHSMSQHSDGVVEQRLIGAKKDPDSEALEHAILLSQQESEYGVNMYDALTPSDEPVIDEYVAQGFTREEAILIIFEEKYGKVSSQQRSAVTPAMPTVYNTIADEDNAKRSDEDEAEIIVLMARGYTREQACNKIDQDRERAAAAARNPLPSQYANSSNNFPAPNSARSVYNDEDELTQAEEREVDHLLRTGVWLTPAEAIDDVINRRVNPNPQNRAAGSEEQQIVALMQLGYSRDQARQEYQRRQALATANNTSSNTRNVPLNVVAIPKDADQIAIDELMNRGFTLDQATQMHYSSLDNRQPLASRSNSGGNVRSETGDSRYSEPNRFPSSRSDSGRDRDRERGGGELRRSGSRDRERDERYRSRDARSDSGRDLREYRDGGRQISSNRSDGGGGSRSSSRDVRGRDRLDSREYSSANGSFYPPNNAQSFRNETYSVASSREAESFYDGRDNYQREPQTYAQRPIPPIPPVAIQQQAPPPRNADELAMQMALLISQQEAEFGINMYDSLTPADQPEIDAMTANGFTADEAIQALFDRRYRRGPVGYGGRPMNGNNSMYAPQQTMQRNNSGPAINSGSFSRSGSGNSEFNGYGSRQPVSPRSPRLQEYDSPRVYQNNEPPPPPPRESSFFRASSMVGRTNSNSFSSPARSNSGGLSDGEPRRRQGGGRQKVRRSDVKRITDVLDVSDETAIEALLANDCQVQPAIASLLR